jgi:hypothetical protein
VRNSPQLEIVPVPFGPRNVLLALHVGVDGLPAADAAGVSNAGRSGHILCFDRHIMVRLLGKPCGEKPEMMALLSSVERNTEQICAKRAGKKISCSSAGRPSGWTLLPKKNKESTIRGGGRNPFGRSRCCHIEDLAGPGTDIGKR